MKSRILHPLLISLASFLFNFNILQAAIVTIPGEFGNSVEVVEITPADAYLVDGQTIFVCPNTEYTFKIQAVPAGQWTASPSGEQTVTRTFTPEEAGGDVEILSIHFTPPPNAEDEFEFDIPVMVTVINVETIKATLGGQTFTSMSSDLSFTANAPLSIPKKAGTFDLEATGLQPNNPTVLNLIKWHIRRNPDDVLTGTLPDLKQDATDKLKATLGTDSQGSFNVIVYADCNSNGSWDQNETLKAINAAIIRVSLRSNTKTVRTKDNFSTVTVGSSQCFSSGDAKKPAISFAAPVLLEGGGSDAKLGLNKIHVGWLGNVIGLDFFMQYPSGHRGTWMATNPLSLLDTARNNPGTGGDSAFRSSSLEGPAGIPPGTGEGRFITALDAPGNLCFFNNFPGTTDHGTLTDKGVAFNDYLSTYSDDFNKSYSINGTVNWSVNFKFEFNGKKWKDRGSITIGLSAINTLGTPQSAIDAGVKTTPPTIGQSAFVDYK